MKDNWKHIKSKISDNIKDIIESSTTPKFSDLDQALELFKNVLNYFYFGKLKCSQI